MRVALCLYGLTGSADFGLGLGKPIDPRLGHHFHTKNIIEPNENVDVFFHTWSVEFEEMLEARISRLERYKEQELEEVNKSLLSKVLGGNE